MSRTLDHLRPIVGCCHLGTKAITIFIREPMTTKRASRSDLLMLPHTIRQQGGLLGPHLRSQSPLPPCHLNVLLPQMYVVLQSRKVLERTEGRRLRGELRLCSYGNVTIHAGVRLFGDADVLGSLMLLISNSSPMLCKKTQ